MNAVVPILSYTELPPGSCIGFERTSDGCIVRFRTAATRAPARCVSTPPTWRELIQLIAVLLVGLAVLALIGWVGELSWRTLMEVLAAVMGGMIGVCLAFVGLFGILAIVQHCLVSFVKIVVTRHHLTLHTRCPGRPVIRHRVGQIASVNIINGRLSMQLLDGHGWLDGAGVGPFYFEDGIRADELKWLVRTLRQELGLSAKIAPLAPISGGPEGRVCREIRTLW